MVVHTRGPTSIYLFNNFFLCAFLWLNRVLSPTLFVYNYNCVWSKALFKDIFSPCMGRIAYYEIFFFFILPLPL